MILVSFLEALKLLLQHLSVVELCETDI